VKYPILGACFFLVGQIIGQIKKGLNLPLVTTCKSVVPTEQMSNFFLEDLVRLAKLAA